jgi:precorrin-6Y C5,15-methyltransferase (decarboxylating)
MTRPIHVLGLGADGIASLSERSRAVLAGATFVAGGRRHLELVRPVGLVTFTITNNLPALVDRLRERGPDERCVVLATGDPFCFGIATYLRAELARDELIVEPAVSSLQLAFARVGRSWESAVLASVHGRPLGPTLLPILGAPLIGLLTSDGQGPAAVADYFNDRGLGDDYAVWVCEDLGSAAERVTRHEPLSALSGRAFSKLNIIILERLRAVPRPFPWSVPLDEHFAQPDSGPILLTHADIRALALSRFDDLPDGPIWDIGAGLGGIAIGLAGRFRGTEIIAVERSANRLDYLRANRRRFEAWNLRIVPGEAPEALDGEEPPAGVFLGGSGGRLAGILDRVAERLRPRGVLVADFIGLENLSQTLGRLRALGWAAEVSQVQIGESRDLAGLTTFAPLRPVWIVRARQSEPGSID